MNCIDFCVIFKYCVKQLMIFGRTVVAASDLKNCTMVNCETGGECFRNEIVHCLSGTHGLSRDKRAFTIALGVDAGR